MTETVLDAPNGTESGSSYAGAVLEHTTKEVLDEIETSADYRYDAQMLTLAVAK